MSSVTLKTVDSQEGPALIESWRKEDHYYDFDQVGGEINKKARRYPYVISSEGKASTQVVKVSVPINGPLKILYLDGRSDSGFPHTRGLSGIALPVFLLWNPNPNTIQHEIVHLSQKQFKARWYKFYEDEWKFRVAKGEEFMAIPERWRSRRRINPDTLGTPYMIWKDRYIPLSVFISDVSPDLKACRRGFWDLQMSQWTWEPPSGWAEAFGTGFNDEHPNEIAAHWIDGSAGKERASVFSLGII
jgi:hypothetical protein